MGLTPEISVLLGAIVGGGMSIIINLVQQKFQLKRELMKTAYQMAIDDFNTQLKYAKSGDKVLPLEAFVTYYIKYFEIVKSKNVDLKDISKIQKFREELNNSYLQHRH